MSRKFRVLNNTVGSPHAFNIPELSKEEEASLLAGLFEHLLIFDEVIISTGRNNTALFYLVKNVGLELVERLLEAGYIKILLWTPVIVTSPGKRMPNGTIDESVIIGKPPIISGALSPEDLDPEHNIKNALTLLGFDREAIRNFARKASTNYIIPDGMEYSSKSAEMVIDAYKSNLLSPLGLPFGAEPEQMNYEQRAALLHIGVKVLESAVLSKYDLKSFENYEHFEICKESAQNIGQALKITEGNSTILQLENLPDLRALYLSEKLSFESLFKIRHLPSAKHYRTWINTIGENANADELRTAYLNEVKDKNSFAQSNRGKFVRNLTMFGISNALSAVIPGAIGKVAEYGLGLFDTYCLDNMLKGQKPNIYIDHLRKTIPEEGIARIK